MSLDTEKYELILERIHRISTGREHVDGDNASRLRKIIDLIHKFDKDKP